MGRADDRRTPWGEFRKVDESVWTPRDWRETIDGGQAFTWNETGVQTEFEGVFGGVAARAKLDECGRLWVAFPAEKEKRTEFTEEKKLEKFREYVGSGNDFGKIRAALASSGDPHLLRALEIYPTLRILRQNPSEAIVAFICSSSKRIVQIKQCVAALSRKFGRKIDGGFYAMPDFETLARSDVSEILECKLGFRAKYLSESAKKISADKFDPEWLREMPYAEAKKYLVSLSGIGEKVADCILLFGCSRFEAFPVDTWIRQAMSRLYGTENDPKKIRAFASEKFPLYAGFAQQLVFAAMRNNML